MKFVTDSLKRKRDIVSILSLSIVIGFALNIIHSEIRVALASTDITPFVTASIANQVISSEPARYSFASKQETTHLQVIPGETTDSTIIFYNVDGNRTTHILLEITDAPAGWQIKIDPPKQKQHYDNSIVEENLHSEPATIASEEIRDIPPGMVCLTLPNRGYTLARTVTITIRVPESEVRDTIHDIHISAEASWTGETDGGIIRQTRDFDYSVEVLE